MFSAGKIVYYRANGGQGALIQGVIRRVANGWLTVEARFFAREGGQPEPGYLGYTYKLRPADIVAVAL